MAEFCLDCWNKISGTNNPPIKYVISINKEFCEECCQFKHTIIMTRKAYYKRFFESLIFIVIFMVRALYDIVTLPYHLWKVYKHNKNRK